jgi:hypothetical protein
MKVSIVLIIFSILQISIFANADLLRTIKCKYQSPMGEVGNVQIEERADMMDIQFYRGSSRWPYTGKIVEANEVYIIGRYEDPGKPPMFPKEIIDIKVYKQSLNVEYSSSSPNLNIRIHSCSYL